VGARAARGGMSGQAPPNAAERHRWNDPNWIATWLTRERLTSFTTGPLLSHLAPAPGERVLEVGSGTGRLTEALARAVGPQGAVVGVDLSEGLTELAGQRARTAGLDNVAFVVTDAQVDAIGGGPFDAVTSQFGVMFFDDPKGAFSNLARHLTPGGRLAVVTWQGVEANPWYVMGALAPFLPETRRPSPGAATGPFSMGDAGWVTELLGAAGWREAQCTPHEQRVVVERSVLISDDERALADISETDRPAAVRAMEAQLEAFRLGAASYEVPIAFQVFTARRV
jgi:SAM-dependent methyltransferase